MSSSRKRRLDLSDRACLECQRRKTRCIPNGDDKPCEYCNRTGKRCHFAEPPARTPLTRKNLDALESRCQHLESIIEGLQSSHPLPVSNAIDLSHGVPADPGHAVGTPYEWNENQGRKSWSATPPSRPSPAPPRSRRSTATARSRPSAPTTSTPASSRWCSPASPSAWTASTRALAT